MKNLNKKNERISCFNSYTTELLQLYFYLYGNIKNYFRLRSIQESVTFQIGINGEFRFKPLEKQSALLNKIAADVFYSFNRTNKYLKENIIPAKSSDGSPAILTFNLPIKFNTDDNYINDIDKKPILFTLEDGEYTVRLDEDFTFHIYNKENELVRIVNSIMEFYYVDVLRPLTLETKHLIVEKDVSGKSIKLEVENLFKNYEADLKISYFEDDNWIKEFNSMEKFLKSDQSQYIY